MHEAISFLLRETASKLIEVAVGRVFEPRTDGSSDSDTPDPVAAAQEVMDAFLSALRSQDFDGVPLLCDPEWAEHPNTESVMNDTFAAAPPVSWDFRNTWAPPGWTRRGNPAWVISKLAVTFDLGDGTYDTIHGLLRAVPAWDGWKIAGVLWEATDAAPDPHLEPASSVNLLSSRFQESQAGHTPPSHAILECPQCDQQLRVPADQGRLRVGCPRCGNLQWYGP